MSQVLFSPWGMVQTSYTLCDGVYAVSTASHGGILVHRSAEHLLSQEAQYLGTRYGVYLCYEEDCKAPIVIRELLDSGKIIVPVNDRLTDEEFNKEVNENIQRWNPEYWEAYEKRMAAPQEREGRMMRINQSPEKFNEYKQNTMNEIQEKISKQKSKKSREREER